MKKIISVLLCLALACALFAGCSSKKDNIDLIYPFDGKINSYDPQTASTEDEFLVAENCFEGLVRCDDDGNVSPGCAASWDISADKKTYVFYLSKGLRWYVFNSVKKRMGEKYDPEITANDFVFALQRAVMPSTSAPLYSTISNIVNADKVNAGRLSPDKLGVRAADDYTLEIRLSSPVSNFLQVLSTAVAMPCNREFFEKTNGRYGLDLQYTMFNGQFIVTNELESSYILKKSSAYSGPSPATATDLTLRIAEEDEDIIGKLKSGYYDAAYIRGYESAEISGSSGIKLVPYSNITWALVINSEKSIFADEKARHAVGLSLSEARLDKHPYLKKAKGFIPPSCQTANGSYTDSGYAVAEKSDPSQAVKLWKEAVKDASEYTIELTLLAPDYMEDTAKELLQGVQSSIGSISNAENDKKISFTLKLETKTEAELKRAVESGNYDFALYPFTASASSPVSFLQAFLTNAVSRFESEGFSKALAKASAADASNLAVECFNCEKELMKTHCFIPLLYEESYYAQAKGISGVRFHPGTGRVCFVFANRE